MGELWTDVDHVLFRRAVSNLISNSLAHTPVGGIISVLAVQLDDGVRVEVADSGIGIAPDHLPHVFDRFYRVQRTARNGSGGCGLGLSIVKTIMTLHGGSAEIISDVGRGTRATLFFPQPHGVEAALKH
jgi:signal transduction histidine kinase